MLDDPSIRQLATRLRLSAGLVTEPQRSRILARLPETLFISHTSLDDEFIKGGSWLPRRESILWVCWEVFPDPFYHSRRTGGADAYERIVGLALSAATRILVVWSENAAQSEYVRAELLVASEDRKKLAAFIMEGAPPLPILGVELIADLAKLHLFLRAW